jgi:hypothetical protein
VGGAAAVLSSIQHQGGAAARLRQFRSGVELAVVPRRHCQQPRARRGCGDAGHRAVSRRRLVRGG